jgi:peptidoglycan-N-acetylglucosamine deacetylase
LDILDRYHAKATFFCIGTLAERHPDLCRDIVRRGHAVENHSQHHNVLFSLFGPLKIYHEVQLAQSTLAGITGQSPRFFRPSAGLRNPLLDPVLAYLGLHLVSWSRRGFDTRESNPDVVFNKLAKGLKGGDILLLHDGNAARTPEGIPVILNVLPRLLENLARARLHAVTLRAALA